MCVTHLEIRTTGQALGKMFVYGASNTRPARHSGHSPLDMGRRWEPWRLCAQDPSYRAGGRVLLFCLLAAAGLPYNLGEVKGRLCWRTKS